MATEADLKQMARALSLEIKDLCQRKFSEGNADDLDVMVNALMYSLITLCAAAEVPPQTLIAALLHSIKATYNHAGKFKVECGMGLVDKGKLDMADVNDYGPAFGTKPSKYEVN